MSRHGEPHPPYGGPEPPYGDGRGRPDEQGYDPPSDPWGQADSDLTAPRAPGGYPYGGPPYDPGYEPALGEGGHPAPVPVEAGWDPEPAPEPPAPRSYVAAPPDRRGGTLLFVAVGVLVVVVAGAVGYALYLLSGEDGTPVTGPTPGPVVITDPTASPGADPEPESTQNRIGLNATQAREGDCLVNHGNPADPEMQIVPCDSPESSTVYEVMGKFDQAVEGEDRAAQDVSAQQICAGIDGYTHHYFEVSETFSFVLCMQERLVDPGEPDE